MIKSLMFLLFCLHLLLAIFCFIILLPKQKDANKCVMKTKPKDPNNNYNNDRKV